MRIFYIIFLIITNVYVLYAQKINFVLNPSFEEHNICPPVDSIDGGIYFNQCKWWNSPTGGGTPDYYISCSLNPWWSTPNNAVGYEVPHFGEAYAGIVTYYSITPFFDGREYIQGQLKDSLVANRYYIFRCYISLADGTFGSKFCIDNFGVYFSDTLVDYPLLGGTLPFTPYYNNPVGNTLNIKDGWQMIEGSFRANGGEKYIILGNFDRDADVDIIDCNGTGFVKGDEGFTYIYIDDVAVYDTTEIDSMSICVGDSLELDGKWYKNTGLYTKTITGLPTKVYVQTINCDTIDNTCKIAIPSAFTPNNDGINDEWNPLIKPICEDKISNYLLRIFNRWGEIIFTSYDKNETWKGINNEMGTYVYYLQYDLKNNTKILQGSVELIR